MGGGLVTHTINKGPVFLIYRVFVNQFLKYKQLNRKIQDKKIWIHSPGEEKKETQIVLNMWHSTSLLTR